MNRPLLLVLGACTLGTGVLWLSRLNREPELTPAPAVKTAPLSSLLYCAELIRLQQAEDEAYEQLTTCGFQWQKNKQDRALQCKKDELVERYQKQIRLSDEEARRSFTPDVIERTPWRDLLADKQASAWIGCYDIDGFERRLENGVLHLVRTKASANFDPVITIGDNEVWRDMVIDMEFTIHTGSFDVFFRLPPWDESVYSLAMKTQGEDALEPGRSHQFAFHLLGSECTWTKDGEDEQYTDLIPWTKPRKGALGISLPENADIEITRLRIKVLR